jgi:hypothetical protein
MPYRLHGTKGHAWHAYTKDLSHASRTQWQSRSFPVYGKNLSIWHPSWTTTSVAETRRIRAGDIDPPRANLSRDISTK